MDEDLERNDAQDPVPRLALGRLTDLRKDSCSNLGINATLLTSF